MEDGYSGIASSCSVIFTPCSWPLIRCWIRSLRTCKKTQEKFHLSDPLEESLLKREGKHLSIKMGVFKTTSPTCCIQALVNKGHLPFSAGNLVNLFHQEENFVSSFGDIIPNLLKLHLGKIQHCFTPFYYTKCICVNLCPGIFSHTHIPLSV